MYLLIIGITSGRLSSTEEARGGGAGAARVARSGSERAASAGHVSISPIASNAYSHPAHSVHIKTTLYKLK